MKKLSIIMITGIFMLFGLNAFSQKVKSGDFRALKGQATVNLKYDYSGMVVGKYKVEQEYIDKRKGDMNKKEAGTGDKWAESWVADRTSRFQPMFEKEFNKESTDCGITGKENASDAKYTLIVHTMFTEPGYNVGVTRQNAYINMEVYLVETASPDKILGTIEYKNIQSVNMMGYDYDTGGRIQSCYDRAGGNIGHLICKSLK